MELKRYEVVFTRCGVAFVYAHDESEAMRIADETVKADDVSWDDDWPCTEVQEVEEEN